MSLEAIYSSDKKLCTLKKGEIVSLIGHGRDAPGNKYTGGDECLSSGSRSMGSSNLSYVLTGHSLDLEFGIFQRTIVFPMFLNEIYAWNINISVLRSINRIF